MSTVVRLKCDKCEGEAPVPHYGGTTHARNIEMKNGWWCTIDPEHGVIDLCPACRGRNPDYWTAEPF